MPYEGRSGIGEVNLTMPTCGGSETSRSRPLTTLRVAPMVPSVLRRQAQPLQVCAAVHHVYGLAAERGDSGHGCLIQTRPPTQAPVRAATGASAGATRPAATHPPTRSPALVGREFGDMCPAPVHRTTPGRAPRAQGPPRRYRAAGLACRPRARPSAWGGVRARRQRHAEAPGGQGNAPALDGAPTPEQGSLGRNADDVGQATGLNPRRTIRSVPETVVSRRDHRPSRGRADGGVLHLSKPFLEIVLSKRI
jgi:hypothetical protein